MNVDDKDIYIDELIMQITRLRHRLSSTLEHFEEFLDNGDPRQKVEICKVTSDIVVLLMETKKYEKRQK